MKRSAGQSKGSAELEALRERLREAEETLEAIRSGHVDALVVSSPTGPRVFTLEGADHRYRRLVETMNEGALLVNPAGIVLYSNAAFAAMVSSKLETIVGRSLVDFVDEPSRSIWGELLAAARTRPAAEEVTLRAAAGQPVPAYLSMSPNDDGVPGVSVIVTNLAAQKRNEEIVASERLATSILDQAAEAIVVCDPSGIVIRASRAAHEIAVGKALRQHVYTAFPLRGVGDDAATPYPATSALGGEVALNVEMTLEVPGRDSMHLLCTAAPLLNVRGQILGCVMSLTNVTKQKRAEAERAELLEAERAARTSAEKARLEAEASNRTKDEFLATVSHELRTPLNAIVGWSRMMSEGALSEERQRHAMSVIRRNADAQARLIEDLLDVSRIISGKMRLDVQPVEPVRVITAVIESVRPALDAKQIRLETLLDSEDASILGDETRLQQVIWNLLSNAAKFTPRSGRIRVTLRRIDSAIEIAIEDNGQGIHPDFLPYVFDRFRQADGGIARLHGGLGLGLAISRHLVELHGGKIGVESRGVDRGATFTVRLPRGALRESPLPSAPKQIAATNAAIPLTSPDLKNIHVVLVEDDDDSRELLVDILVKYGARVRSAASGDQALALFESDVPHVLVSDIGMAKMDGYSLIRRVRSLHAGQRVPALALTAYARSEDRRRTLSEGFQMHLAKPVDPTEFAIAVASLASIRPST